ncbi:unnamed protein product [Victoria cruziana]
MVAESAIHENPVPMPLPSVGCWCMCPILRWTMSLQLVAPLGDSPNGPAPSSKLVFVRVPASLKSWEAMEFTDGIYGSQRWSSVDICVYQPVYTELGVLHSW